MDHSYVPSFRPIFGEFPVDMVKLHKDNRLRLLAKMKELFSITSGVVFLKGGITPYSYDTDKELVFRQESNFQYLFGVAEPDCFGAIDVGTQKTLLFVPHLPEDYAVWLGVIYPKEHFQKKYCVDEVHFTEDAEKVLKALNPPKVYHLKSVTELPTWLTQFTTVYDEFKEALDECRLIKSEEEVKLMRYVNKIASYAHVEVMKSCKQGMKEFELEAMFLHLIYVNGRCRHVAYTCICGAGKNGATLHYPNNDSEVKNEHMCLLDMGAEYHCYCSDITCSFPASGKFTEDQKIIYGTVLSAQKAVMAAMKPGVNWEDMHRLANRVICEGMLKNGFCKGTVDELIDNHIGALFFPHGLGHMLGLDTHDVGGYPKGVTKINEPGIKSLRARRVLQKNMVITVEPGIYFIDALLLPALEDPVKSKFLNADKIKSFMNFGGVRLEDDVVVTDNGIENLTICPREIEDVEQVMQTKTHPKFTFTF